MNPWMVGLALGCFVLGLLVLAVGSYYVAIKCGDFGDEPEPPRTPGLKRAHRRIS